MNLEKKYRPFPKVKLENRQWPNREIFEAPIWCSVDLRDGNQALPVPMTVQQKIEMFLLLVRCGFKEIEVGFPASSPTEYEFVRRLIEGNLIPNDVIIQVLVQAREDLIKQTVESLVGAKKVIIHLYNSTSPAQRKVVFKLEKPQIIELAVAGTKWVKEYSQKLCDSGTNVIFQYSAESFSATEVEFAVEVCSAVIKEWNPSRENKMIINLPETVEVTTPNVYADQVEWFCRNVNKRGCIIVSVHTHNDRGTGVASTELGLMAGAERVEGTLFGNGERTGNVDIVTVALNMFGQGIDNKLYFSDIDSVREVYERCTGMKVPPRQPYSGELVFTAFSGSHQDAIRKGLNRRVEYLDEVWDVPYLLIDPKDIGRQYKEVIRVNGQSGKGGVTYLLERECGINMPKGMQIEFGVIAGKEIDALGREVTSDDLREMFWKEYINNEGSSFLVSFNDNTNEKGCNSASEIIFRGTRIVLRGFGNGPISSFINSLNSHFSTKVHVIDQCEHTLGSNEEASAIAYVLVQFCDGITRWGAGIDTDIKLASIKAVISALSRK